MPLQVGEFFTDECPRCAALTVCEVLERHPSGEVKTWKHNPEHLAWHQEQDRFLRWFVIDLLLLFLCSGIILGVVLTG